MKVESRTVKMPKNILAGYLRMQSCRLSEIIGNLESDNHLDYSNLENQLKDFEEMRLRMHYEGVSS